MTQQQSGFTLSAADMQDEIDRDRRSERRLVWYTVIALVAAGILIATRLIFL